MKFWIIVATTVAMMGGAGLWYLSTRPNPPTTDNEAMSGTQSWSDVIARAKPQVCTFRWSRADDRQTWTMYTDGQRVRGDYTVESVGAAPWTGHIIRGDEYSYQWAESNGQNIATKVKTSVIITADEGLNTNVSGFRFDQPVDMDCSAWRIDESQFEPPADVDFTDMTPQLEANPGLTAAAKAAACSACDASAETRDQCRAALGC